MTNIDNLPILEDPSEIISLLEEKLKDEIEITSWDQFPDPYTMKGMDQAVDVFAQAITLNQRIKFVLDADCDGIGTFTLWWNFFKNFPYSNIELIITDRKQGYGFIPLHIDDKTGLYITSDNGITAVPACEAAHKKGAKVIICDHHQIDPDLDIVSAADAVIDPHQPGCSFPYKDISGTFVLWFFLKALIKKYGMKLDPQKEFLPELALTTISDVMPINKHLNRFVLKEFIREFPNIKHREYMNTFRREVNAEPTAEDFAFGLTPMINAAQRLVKADYSAQFLVADTQDLSQQWFEYLQGINNARKERQQNLLSYIEKYFKDYISQPFIVIPGRFHKEFKGTLGIAAGRLAEANHKPTIVLNYNKETKEYSGSGRSTGELNILELLRDNKYVKQVGGHTAALGITVTEDNWEDFYTSLQEKTKKIPAETMLPKIEPLGFIPINKIDLDFFLQVHKMEPFGQGFIRPIFVTKAVVKSARLVGKQRNHLTLVITDTKGLVKFSAMQFFTTEVPEKGEEYYIYFNFDEDKFRGGGKVQLKVKQIIRTQG